MFYAQSPSPFLPLSTNHQLQQGLGEEGSSDSGQPRAVLVEERTGVNH